MNHLDPRTRNNSVDKKLSRNTTDKVIGGVCGGIARFFGIDPSITRLVVAALVLFTGGGIGVVAYLLAWFLVPDDNANSGVDWAIQQLRSSTGDGGAPHRGDDLR